MKQEIDNNKDNKNSSKSDEGSSESSFTEPQKTFKGSVLLRLFGYTSGYRLLMLVAVIFLVVGTLIDIARPIIVQQAIDNNIYKVYSATLDAYPQYKVEKEITVNLTTNFVGADNKSNESVRTVYFVPNSEINKIPIKEFNTNDNLSVAQFPAKAQFYIVDMTKLTDENRTKLINFAKEHNETTIFADNYIVVNSKALLTYTVAELTALRTLDLSELFDYFVIYLVLIGVGIIFAFGKVLSLTYVTQNMIAKLRIELLEHTLFQSQRFLQSIPSGVLVSRLTNDVQTVSTLFSDVFSNLLRNFSLLFGSLVALILFDWQLTLMSLTLLIPVYFILRYFSKRSKMIYLGISTHSAKIMAFLAEHINGHETIQIYNNEQHAIKKFRGVTQKYLEVQLDETKLYAYFRPLIALMENLTTALIIYIGSIFLNYNLLTAGVLILFVSLFGRFYEQLLAITEQFTVLQSSIASGEKIFTLLDSDDRIEDNGHIEDISNVHGVIEFKNVNFFYTKKDTNNPDQQSKFRTKQVLFDINFKLERNEKVALVGFSGAGKTTITSLINRFWDLESNSEQGEILIDGKNIKEYKISALRKLVTNIQQEPFMFSGTVFDNIALKSNISKEKVHEICKEIYAYDGLIKNLPEEYDTYLEENGNNLSAGQKQLLAFARALVHDSRVIILDEATSNIDSETEKYIQKGLQKVLENRTTIAIAHRLSTIKSFDKILVFDKGHIIESGNHAELLALGGLYYKLYQLQFQEEQS